MPVSSPRHPMVCWPVPVARTSMPGALSWGSTNSSCARSEVHLGRIGFHQHTRAGRFRNIEIEKLP